MSAFTRFPAIRYAAIALFLTIFASTTLGAIKLNTRGMRYLHYTTQSDEAYAKKDWERAIFYRELIVKMAPLDNLNYYNLACCYALDDKPDKAFEALSNSIRYGWCDSEHIKRDTDFASIRDDDRFKAVLKEVRKCDKESQFVYEPESKKRDESVDLLIALCGFGSNPRAFGHEFIPVADQLGIPVVALKGRGETRSKGIYGWHKGQNPNDLDVEGAVDRIDEVIKARGADPQKVIIVGFSQGAALALKMVADHPDKYRGALAIAGGSDDNVFRQWIANAKESTTRIVMIAGELDQNRPFSQVYTQPIVDAGVKLKYEILPQVGHEMPDDGTKLYVDAIRFLTEDG